jgi:hypothetical protein
MYVGWETGVKVLAEPMVYLIPFPNQKWREGEPQQYK